MPMAVSDDTVEFNDLEALADRFFAMDEAQYELEFAAATHVGLVRGRNEDHYAVVRNTRTRDVLFANLPADALVCPEEQTYGMAVADGIGGAAAGHLASRLAVQTTLDL